MQISNIRRDEPLLMGDGWMLQFIRPTHPRSENCHRTSNNLILCPFTSTISTGAQHNEFDIVMFLVINIAMPHSSLHAMQVAQKYDHLNNLMLP